MPVRIWLSKTDPKRINKYKITRFPLILNCEAFQNGRINKKAFYVPSVIRKRPYNANLKKFLLFEYLYLRCTIISGILRKTGTRKDLSGLL